MIHTLDQIVLRTINVTDYANVLYYPYNGLFEHCLANVDAFKKIYFNKNDLLYEWGCDHWPIKFNAYTDFARIPRSRIDAVVVNHRSQIDEGRKVADALQCHLIAIDHEIPSPHSKTSAIQYMNNKMPKDVLFLPSHNIVNESWLYKPTFDVPIYGFDVKTSWNKDIQVLVMGDYHFDDYSLIEVMKNSHPNTETVGNNPNTNKYVSFDNLYNKISASKITVSACQTTKPPILQLLAASTHSLVITNRTPWTEHVFVNGENALLYDDPYEIEQLCKINDDKRREIIENAARMISEFYNIEDVKTSWSNLFKSLKDKTYLR